MGTRAIIQVYSGDLSSPLICTMYKQFDGYPDGLGVSICKALGSKKLVNGLGGDKNVVNGINCAAAMLVGALKDGKAGNLYLYRPDPDQSQEFIYRIFEFDDALHMRVEDPYLKNHIIYDGLISEFDPSKCGTEPEEDEAA